MARPYVLKPVNEGSSVGVAIVTNESNYGNPIGRDVEGPWKHFDSLLAEPFVKGHELTVAVLNDEALAVTELKPKVGFYDYDSKYTDGLTEHVCPAAGAGRISPRSMMDMAAKAHRLLGCRGASRSDFRWDDEQGEAGIFLLEVNTQPGMTPLSLVPEQAKVRGISYGELVERLIEEALDRSEGVTDGSAARRGSDIEARKAAPKAQKAVRSARANKLAAFGFSGFLLLMAGARRSLSIFRPRRRFRRAKPSEAPGSASTAIRSSAWQMDRKLVDAVVIDELRRAASAAGETKPAQPLVDVTRIRERLLRFGWVKDARVSRRLPDTLVIDIVERHAVGAVAGPAAAFADR